MKRLVLSRRSALTALCGLALTVTVSVVPTAGYASTTADASADSRLLAMSTAYHQLVGKVAAPAYFEASVPTKGAYVLKYDVKGVAFFGASVDNIDWGYAGGSTGAHQTRTVQLNAGGHLIHVVGPDGLGTADVYIVRVP